MPEFTIGNYLATRLEQIGIKHCFMVPGDYNLVLLDQLLANKNIQQIGCCNELNASYAAEAYARVNGCGAVVTTMNVGSFSALNGLAGAYAERLPVIFVASGYNTNDASANHLLHHSLGTRDFSYQYEMFKYVTCAAVRIVHPDNAPSMIDDAIRTALRERKPAYIEIACNLSDAPCPEPGPYEAIMAAEESNSHAPGRSRRPGDGPAGRGEEADPARRSAPALLLRRRRRVPRRRRGARLRRGSDAGR
jgi:pyruvate decarboxylase